MPQTRKECTRVFQLMTMPERPSQWHPVVLAAWDYRRVLRPILPHTLLPLLLHPLLERTTDTWVIMTARSFRIDSSVHGHHVYKDQWTPVLERRYKPPESCMIHFLWQWQRKEILLDMFLKRSTICWYFWRRTTQLYAKLLTSANIQTFEEKYWKFHASSHLLANQDMWMS